MLQYTSAKSAALLGTAFETVHTASAQAGVETEISELVFRNTHASTAMVVTVAIVPSGGTNSDAFNEVSERTLLAGEEWRPSAIGQMIPAGGTLQAKSDTASGISWFAKIRQRSR